MKTLDEVIKVVTERKAHYDEVGCFYCHYSNHADCVSGCVLADALHYLKDLKSYVMGEQSKIAAFGKRLSNNVAVLPEGVYCNVCGTRLDLDEDDDNEDA